MPTLTGNCVGCGKYVERYCRPGKPLRCIDCGINYMAEYQLRQHYLQTPETQRSLAAGEEMSEQFRRREGGWYERWREGMLAVVNTHNTTKDVESDTILPTSTRAKRKPKKE